MGPHRQNQETQAAQNVADTLLDYLKTDKQLLLISTLPVGSKPGDPHFARLTQGYVQLPESGVFHLYHDTLQSDTIAGSSQRVNQYYCQQGETLSAEFHDGVYHTPNTDIPGIVHEIVHRAFTKPDADLLYVVNGKATWVKKGVYLQWLSSIPSQCAV